MAHGHVWEIDIRRLGLAHRGKNGFALCPQTDGASERGRLDSVRAGTGETCNCGAATMKRFRESCDCAGLYVVGERIP